MNIPNLNIAVLQTDIVWKDIKTNLDRYGKIIAGINKPTDLIVLPEMFNTGFCTQPHDIAETADGYTFEWMADIAQKTLAVVTGSVILQQNNNYYNALVWMKPNGLYSLYLKKHLFSVSNEDKYMTSGKEKIIEDILGWKICPLICYDLRFPVWSKNTYKDGKYEYDVLVYVANWPQARAHVFRKLLQARAIENLAYAVGVNRVGTDGNKLYYSGNSAVIDFKGNYMHEIKSEKEDVIISYLDYKQLDSFRKNFNVGADWDNFTINNKK